MREIPVILGTGITGLAASYHLSQEGIEHVLAGPEPDSIPKLGESLDITGTVELLTSFPWLSRHFYPKSYGEILTAQSHFHCSLLIGGSVAIRSLFHLKRQSPPGQLIHLERVGFDSDLFDEVRRSPSCQYVLEKALAVGYDRHQDKVTSVQFSDRKIPASFIFDCTAFNGPVAQTAQLPYETMSSPQTVAFCHFRRRRSIRTHADLRSFERQTNLFRMYYGKNGIDAFGWCIPLGNTLSVGLAMDRDREVPAEEAIHLATQFISRQKLPYLDEAGERTPAKNIHHSYFSYKKIYGKNYLLAGPSACQIWYMTGSGVGCGLLAVRLMPVWLKDPVRYSKLYDGYLRNLILTHTIFESLRYWDEDEKTKEAYQAVLKNIARSNFRRTALYYRTQNCRFQWLAWEFLYYLSHLPGILAGYCNPLKKKSKSLK